MKTWTFATLLAAVAVALCANAAIASATTLTSPTGTETTPTLEIENEGHILLHNPIAKIECSSTVKGAVEKHGKETAASGAISTLTFTSCTNSWHVTTISAGTFAIEWTSGYEGDVYSSGATVETTRLGVSCRYATSNTKVGRITGGSPATVHIEASIPFHNGSGLCGNGSTAWTGSYKVASPSSLYVDKEPVTPPKANGSLTSPTGTVATPTIEAESEGHVTLDHPIANIQCQWSFKGTTKSHGPEEEVKIPLSSLSTTGCTESWHGTTVTAGELKIAYTSSYNGTVTWTGATVEMTRLGTTCRYKTENTKLGTLTAGAPATIDIEAKLPFDGGSMLCGEEAYSLTGGFKVTSPSALYVDKGVEVPPILTSPTGTAGTPTIKAESEGHITLDHPIANIQCNWTFEGTTESHSTKEGATVPLSSLSTTGCTESWHGTTVTAGKLIILKTSGYNASVTWTGATVEMTRLGTTCRYKTENTKLGTLTGGSPATIDLEMKLPFHSGSSLCGESYSLTGSIKVT